MHGPGFDPVDTLELENSYLMVKIILLITALFHDNTDFWR